MQKRSCLKKLLNLYEEQTESFPSEGDAQSYIAVVHITKREVYDQQILRGECSKYVGICILRPNGVCGIFPKGIQFVEQNECRDDHYYRIEYQLLLVY